ncbi:TPA: hypothetical protein MDC20_003282 [Morganella morganii]|uniref:hypothetical protein n=1 Tax=Morganella morganii TaxID=582 RepID=UPI000F5B33E3|nr:hypothetical protein [Morganella morganii]HBU8232617.1 hypothetical protein [Morganella morganii]
MNITINAKRVTSLTLTQDDENESVSDKKLHISIGSEIFENHKNRKLFRIRYPFNLVIKGVVTASLNYDFDFISDEDVSSDTLSSELVTITAPSLAFPYIKTYIENVLSSSGYAGISIPFLDFSLTPLNQR